MIKHLREYNRKHLNSISSQTVKITEKIDAPYFTIVYNEGAPTILKSNHTPLSDVDCLLNSNYEYIRKAILRLFGNLGAPKGEFGIWYVPNKSPWKEKYPKYAGKIILARYSADINIFAVTHLQKNGILPPPVLFEGKFTPEQIKTFESYLNGKTGDIMFLTKILKGVRYHGTPITDMDGIIIKIGAYSYQIPIKETKEPEQDKSRKMYRDVVLKDFLKWFKTQNAEFGNENDYIFLMSSIFLQYIKDTDLITKYSISGEDLVPPSNGLMGDLNFDLISDSTVRTICLNDPVRKGIYRILLNTFRKPIKKKPDDLLTETDVEEINTIVEKIGKH